jgi:hypothetical protein
LCQSVQPAAEISGLDVVDELLATVDLDHRQPFAVPRLELGVAADVDHAELELALGANLFDDAECLLAEVTAVGLVDRDRSRDKGPG